MKKWKAYANLCVVACVAAAGVACIAFDLHVAFWPLWVGTCLVGYGAVELSDTLRKW